MYMPEYRRRLRRPAIITNIKTMSKETIHYVSDSKFQTLTKKQKAELPAVYEYDEIEISRLILVPTNRKNSGYFVGNFYAYTPHKGWWRPMTYDCWSIVTDIQNPATLKYQILQGDFENGGVQIFGFLDEYHTAYISYGGRVTIKRKI